MARISGMILGLGMLIVFSSMASPASGWDDDDDDNYKRYKSRRIYGGPAYRQPILIQPRYVERHYDYPEHYGPPQYQPIPQAPLAPPPLPPESLYGGYQSIPSEPFHAPQVHGLPQDRPGQFVNAAVPLYPYVRVKDGDKAPRFGIFQIVAVRSPDPFRFPGSVYVQISIPPGPSKKVKVEDGGAKIKLEYRDYEIEIKSSRGVVSVEYDD